GRVEIRSVIEQGNTVLAEGRMTGTHKGPLATPGGREIPPTGKRIDLATADVFEVEDGKVKGHRVYFDQLDLMSQLGLLPEPAGRKAGLVGAQRAGEKRDQQQVDEEAASVLGHDDALAEPLTELARLGERVLAGGDAAHHLEQTHHRRWVEEVRADHALRPRGG